MNWDPLKLEAIYYSHPIPRDQASLSLLGFVFDKVYFPGASLPTEGFDLKAVEKEIERLREWEDDYDTAQLIGVLKFLKHVPDLTGFCEFEQDSSKIFSDNRYPPQTIAKIYNGICGPPPRGFIPTITSAHNKGLPGGDASISYRGEFHQFANAILESSRTGIPIVNDTPDLPIFCDDVASPINDAEALAGMLSVLSMRLLLPEIPVLSPKDLMEFRTESASELRSFRGSMLGYAKDLNSGLIQQGDTGDIQKHAEFFVKTEIAPRLDELRMLMEKRNSGWFKRSLMKIVPGVAAGYMTGGQWAALAALITGSAAHVPSELRSASGAAKQAKANGLYYLLKVEKSG